MTDKEINFKNPDTTWMQHALTLAQHAKGQQEVPVGAVLISENKIIGEGWNQSISQHDPTAHAEIIALREAGTRIKNYRLLNTTLYVTLEPCAMCVGAMIHARIQRLVFGASEPKAGCICSVKNMLEEKHFNHRIEFTQGILEEQCGELLRQFFYERR